MEKVLSCKVVKSFVTGKDWKLSQEGLVLPIMLPMLHNRTVEPHRKAADKNKVGTGRHRAM